LRLALGDEQQSDDYTFKNYQGTGINDYEQEFVKTYFSVISEERVERETEGKIARQHRTTTRNTRVRIKLRLEFELHKLRLETESIRSNVRRASCAEDPKKTSSNYRINIVKVEEHGEQEVVNAVIATGAQIPVVRANVIEGQCVDNGGTIQITFAFGEH
ncbi:hypothetical protein TNIN_79901, partial [Trichonephila inaurata madagascariensis]